MSEVKAITEAKNPRPKCKRKGCAWFGRRALCKDCPAPVPNRTNVK